MGQLIVCDIDGTVADLSHRLKYIKGKPKNWPAFFAGTLQDSPITEIITLMKHLACVGDNTIIFASGRSEECRADTVQWLSNHGLEKDVNFSELFMRAAGDHRQDYIVKKEILDQIVDKYGKKPDLAFDDRQQVVDMWRENGVRCCQVAKGDF